MVGPKKKDTVNTLSTVQKGVYNDTIVATLNGFVSVYRVTYEERGHYFARALRDSHVTI
jgi:hypothetical protein